MEITREAAALLLLGAHDERPAAAPLILDAPEQPAERGREPVDLLDRVALLGCLEVGGLGGVDRLNAVDQLLEWREAPAQHHDVDRQDEHDRRRKQQELPALALHAQVEARRRARREQGRDDEQHIDCHNLACERCMTSWPHRREMGS